MRSILLAAAALVAACQQAAPPAPIAPPPAPAPALPGASSFGDVSVANGLTVSGLASLNGGVSISGSFSASNGLAVTGTLSSTGTGTFSGGATVGGAGLTVSAGGESVTGGEVVNGGATLNGVTNVQTFNASGTSTLAALTSTSFSTSASRVTYGGVDYVSTSSDPTSGGGLSAPVGSWAFDSTSSSPGNVWHKTGAGDTAWTLFSSGSGTQFDAQVFKVSTYGAKCDGVTDDRASIKSALAAACALSPTGSIVSLPGATCMVGRDATNFYSIKVPCSNVTIQGVAGKTVIKQMTGLPATPVVVIDVDTVDRVTIRDLTIDGNWGNAATTITIASQAVALPTSTINVASTADFPAGTVTITIYDTAGAQSVTCTGSTATTFTGCSGGSGTLRQGDQVGYSDANTGLNQGTQVDPKSHGIMSQGSTNLHVENVSLREIYGDCVWMGYSGSDVTVPTRDSRFINTSCYMAARHGVSVGSAVDGVVWIGGTVSNVYGIGWDNEPVFVPVRNVVVVGSTFRRWWAAASASRGANTALAISGGNSSPAQSTAARGFRVFGSLFEGSVQIANAIDVVFTGNRVVEDWDNYARPGVYATATNDDIRIEDNYFYVRTKRDAVTPSACIYFAPNNVNTQSLQPSGITIHNNHCHARNGAYGVQVIGSGQSGTFDTGTASSTGALTLTDSGKAWTTNQWAGFAVRIGTAIGYVSTNTATTLTLIADYQSASSGWQTYTGQIALTPAAGAYVIGLDAGMVEITDNDIEGHDDGNGGGGPGIYAEAAADGSFAWINGSRARIDHNTMRDVGGDAVHIKSYAQAPWRYLEVTRNRAYDDPSVATTTTVVAFENTPNYGKLVMAGNSGGETVTNAITGLTSGVWLLSDGPTQQWAGFGAPAFSCTTGSTYQRLDGAAGSTYYACEAGSWSALATAQAIPPEYESQLGFLGSTFDPNLFGANTTTVTAGTVLLNKVRVYSTSFSKVLFDLTQAQSGATHCYITVYASDGTQSGSMLAATVDSCSSFTGSTSGSAGNRTVSLTSAVTGLTYGADVYVAILITGSPSPTATIRLGPGLANGTLTASQGFRSGTIAGASGGTALPGTISLPGMAAQGAANWIAVQ